ncbi:endoglucanase 4 isoform X1 [Daucus carota subsp. sativus]|uniref:endoglucanase 4 isoform X1 n=1 Tax=Daucus carota subsp. sativus TaxID=79200 RepID=UPI0030829B6C
MMGKVVIADDVKLDYTEALTKSILFFEGQRSGKLPNNQRLTWRKDSGLRDGFDQGVDLVGGYYDAGDNIKFSFPMAFTTTVLAWSVIEFGNSMDSDLNHALEAIRWSTDYLIKCTNTPGVVYAQLGDAVVDHDNWERPEDMDTPRTAFAVSAQSPGSEVSAEIAAALSASSIVFRRSDRKYSDFLLRRAIQVFDFADKYQGSYNDSIGRWVCPHYCDFSGYQDELVWGAAWLHKATNKTSYWKYVMENIHKVESPQNEGSLYEFGWDTKNAGINVLVSKSVCCKQYILNNKQHSSPFLHWADKFACSLLPESLNPSVEFTPGGLMYKPGMVNSQRVTALSFLLVVYARYLKQSDRVIACDRFVATPYRLTYFARTQVDYILGKNPMNMSYMVGYGEKFPERIHHRASSLPSIDQEPHLGHGWDYFWSNNTNYNLLIGAIVGGPDINDQYNDTRHDAGHSEPATYVNAPLVGLLSYFKANYGS